MDNSFVICQCRDKFSHDRASSHSARPMASRETPLSLLATLAPHFPIYRFASSVFSSDYELLFSQLLPFHNHLRCPLFFRCHYSSAPRLSRKSFVCRFAVRFASKSFIYRICAFPPGWQGPLFFGDPKFASHTPPVAASYRGCHNSSLHAFLGVTHGCPR